MNAFTLRSDLHPAPASRRKAEQRRKAREIVSKTGRLAYGGLQPGMVGCQICDLSESGIRVETYATLSEMPEFFTLEFEGNYFRARRVWTYGNEIGLEFIADDGWPEASGGAAAD